MVPSFLIRICFFALRKRLHKTYSFTSFKIVYFSNKKVPKYPLKNMAPLLKNVCLRIYVWSVGRAVKYFQTRQNIHFSLPNGSYISPCLYTNKRE